MRFAKCNSCKKDDFSCYIWSKDKFMCPKCAAKVLKMKEEELRTYFSQTHELVM